MTIDLEKLKQLCAQATSGPWTADVWIETDGNGWRATGPHHEDHDCWTEPGCPDEQAAQRDAAFIAAAREAVPALVAEVERLTDAKLYGEKVCAQLVAERDEARAEVERLTKECDDDRSQRRRAVMAVAICQERIAELERELAEHKAWSERAVSDARQTRDSLRASLDALGRLHASNTDGHVQLAADLRAQLAAVCCAGEPHTCDREAIAAAEAKTDAVIVEREALKAQLHAAESANRALSETLVEHSELNGHIDMVERCRDWIAAEATEGDESGKLHDFVASLRIVVDQLDKQRRSRNWYEVAYTAGKQKLIEHAVDKAVERIDQWLYDEVKRLGEAWRVAPVGLARNGLADKQEAVADLLTAFRSCAWKAGQDGK